MKKIILVLSLVTLSGCANGLAKHLAKMPDGRFGTATIQETDKFTSTKIVMTGVVKDNGVLTAKGLVLDHTDPWVTNFHFEATDVEEQLTPATKKLKLGASETVPAKP